MLNTVTPIAAALDWLLLTSPGRTHLRHASTWLLYPMAYLAFCLTRGELLLPGTPDRYLYPFLDVGQDGFKRVLGNALLLGLSFDALAVLLVGLDHARPNPIRHRGKTGFVSSHRWAKVNVRRRDKQRHRGVAQLGSALRSGRRGRGFKSRHPDSKKQIGQTTDVSSLADLLSACSVV